MTKLLIYVGFLVALVLLFALVHRCVASATYERSSRFFHIRYLAAFLAFAAASTNGYAFSGYLYLTGKLINAQEFQYDRPHYVRIAAIGAHYDVIPEKWETVEDWNGFDWASFNADGQPWDRYKEYFPKVDHPAEYAPDGQFNPSGAYNYSPVFKVDLKSGSVTEVTDW